MEESVVEVDDGGRGGLVGEGVGGDAGASVSVDEGLVEISFFVRSEGCGRLAVRGGATEHEAEEAVQSDEVGAKSVVGVFTIDDFGKVEWIDADVGV